MTHQIHAAASATAWISLSRLVNARGCGCCAYLLATKNANVIAITGEHLWDGRLIRMGDFLPGKPIGIRIEAARYAEAVPAAAPISALRAAGALSSAIAGAVALNEMAMRGVSPE